MPELTSNTQKLIQRYISWHQSLQTKEGIPTIHVDEVVSRVASFYEKIRGVIDWREEHLLRKAAIERILKRRLFLRKDGKELAEPLVYELIRGGHFPNDKIPESKIKDVQKIIDKYVFFLEKSPSSEERQKLNLYDWLSSIAACEIEEILSPPIRENALIEYMEEEMRKRIKVNEKLSLSEEEKNIQIYIAVQKALFKLDPPIISFHLLKRKFPNWN
ncbi:MAG: hypothetical protein DRP84_10520, partial [Spirochaetes bacterium]